MLGDIGGVSTILIQVFGILLNPLIQFNFKFHFFKKLYSIKIKTEGLFKNPKKIENI